MPSDRPARTASTAATRPAEPSSSTRWAPIISQYDQGHSCGAKATDNPMATDCATPSAAASRTQAPVSSSTASAVSVASTSQPNGVNALSTTCSTTQLYGGRTGWLTAYDAKRYSPLPASLPKSGARFHDTL
ncbi:MAG: hypothetical protein R2734_07160 [Nocardioides sp.]